MIRAGHSVVIKSLSDTGAPELRATLRKTMVVSIVMEDVMQSTAPEQRKWAVELNFAGCRIQRWAEKRRHLLGFNPSALALPHAPLRNHEAV